MAELVLKVRTGAGYLDGDCLCAFNDRAIACVHAEHICHPWKAGVTRDGLRPTGTAEDFLIRTSQYRFERVSAAELKRIDLATLVEEVFSDKPNDRGEQMDVGLFIARRLQEKAPFGGPKLAIFGVPGAERWYGGTRDTSPARLNLVWQDIETKTPHRRADFTLYPLMPADKRHFLPVKLDTDMDDITANNMVAPDLDMTDPNNPILIRKRINGVDWQGLLSLTDREKADVLDQAIEFDQRTTRTYTRTVVVQERTR